MQSASDRPSPLDFGCGSGNPTRHLLALDFAVTAADVSPKYPEFVRKRFSSDKLSAMQLNGEDHAELPDGSIDFVATYSAMHRVPDYLGAFAKLGRVVASSSIVYKDPELQESYHTGNSELQHFNTDV